MARIRIGVGLGAALLLVGGAGSRAWAQAGQETDPPPPPPGSAAPVQGKALMPGVVAVPDSSGSGQIICVPTPTQVGQANDLDNTKGSAGERQQVAGRECGSSSVHFDTGKAFLDPDARRLLSQSARCLQSNPGERVTVVGGADPTGSASINQRLGEQRAEAVSDFLQDEGISRDRLQTRSVGSAELVCHERTPDCLARNRRAQLQLGSSSGAPSSFDQDQNQNPSPTPQDQNPPEAK